MTRHSLIALAFSAIVAGKAGAQGESESQRDSTTRKSVGADVGYVSFGGDLEAWRTASVSLAQRGSRGSIIGRVNVANRFGTTGTQVEADAYPRLGSGRYMYLNAGYSGSGIYPGERFFNGRICISALKFFRNRKWITKK